MKGLRVLFLSTVIVCLMASGFPAYGLEINLTPIETRSSLISYGKSTLGSSGTTLLISSSTNTIKVVDYVGVKIHVQRLENGVWQNYYSWTETAAYNADTVADLKSLTAPNGYRYRIKSLHTARHSSTTDSCYSYSSDLYIP